MKPWLLPRGITRSRRFGDVDKRLPASAASATGHVGDVTIIGTQSAGFLPHLTSLLALRRASSLVGLDSGCRRGLGPLRRGRVSECGLTSGGVSRSVRIDCRCNGPEERPSCPPGSWMSTSEVCVHCGDLITGHDPTRTLAVPRLSRCPAPPAARRRSSTFLATASPCTEMQRIPRMASTQSRSRFRADEASSSRASSRCWALDLTCAGSSLGAVGWIS